MVQFGFFVEKGLIILLKGKFKIVLEIFSVSVGPDAFVSLIRSLLLNSILWKFYCIINF